MANPGEHSHMAKKMLIDATHSQESRVAIIDDSILSDYDAETSAKKQYKGNIYLAKIIRIEPSLQAAFVEYGHNRHGFLPFAEIHPDYYRIPVGDRLPEPDLEEEITSSIMPSFVEEIPADPSPSNTPNSLESEFTPSDEPIEISDTSIEPSDVPLGNSEKVSDEVMADIPSDIAESISQRPRTYRYKIQEVIKRRQIVLVQVVKEERGNKGAALTTYLSLPGRYCVLMPNAGHRTGGISRKIADSVDRKRLRSILDDLSIPEGINLIVRTAGQDRNKIEIRRDYEYLIRLWAEIREKTLTSIAPTLVYAEGDLIKRSIRDNYDKAIDEIIVEGEEGYKAAKIFMKNLIPSHAKRVKLYKEPQPLFQRHGVESQIDAIMSPVAHLPSGGSIVINSTEALVAIDVNSGKSTRERHIEETALKTNLEAAEEVARQMRLRDLGGLIVVDFIDMNDPKHIQSVEKRLKDAVRFDRARIQVGRISQFGLLELSRQRLRPSIIESNMRACTHCHGTGLIRSVESSALFVLRAIESTGIEGKSAEIIVTVPAGIDLYLLNQKRSNIVAMEERYQLRIQIQRDESLVPPNYHIDVLVSRDTPLKFVETPLAKAIPVQQIEDTEDEVSQEKGLQDKKEADSSRMGKIEDKQASDSERRSGRSNRPRKNPYQNWRKNRGDNRRRNQPESDMTVSDSKVNEEKETRPTQTFEKPEREVVSQSAPTLEKDQEMMEVKKDNQRRKHNRRRPRRQPSESASNTTNKEKKETQQQTSPSSGNGKSSSEISSETPSSSSPDQKKKESSSSTVSVVPNKASSDTSKMNSSAQKSFNEKKEVLPTEIISPPQTPKKKRGFWSRLLDA